MCLAWEYFGASQIHVFMYFIAQLNLTPKAIFNCLMIMSVLLNNMNTSLEMWEKDFDSFIAGMVLKLPPLLTSQGMQRISLIKGF